MLWCSLIFIIIVLLNCSVGAVNLMFQNRGVGNSFVQLGFSSNVTSDTVTLINFVRNFNFCCRLYGDNQVAKPLSNLYCDSSSNF